MKIWAWMSVAVSITLILLVLSNVPVGLTDLDREYAATISAEYHIPILSEKEANDFSAQMDRLNKAIKFFDDATLDRKQIAIPQGDYRELDAWYAVRSGICSDVSRAAEKFLTYLGFHVRHVSVYTMKNNINPYSVVLTYRNPSHAVAEVLTSKGWMMFDPHFGRLYLDVEKNPSRQQTCIAQLEQVISIQPMPMRFFLIPM